MSRAPSISSRFPASRHSAPRTKWSWHNGGSIGQPAGELPPQSSRFTGANGLTGPVGRIGDLSTLKQDFLKSGPIQLRCKHGQMCEVCCSVKKGDREK
jgi:hypothetical protein